MILRTRKLIPAISEIATALTALLVAWTLTMAGPQTAHAQTFTVLHNFTYGADGAEPLAGLTMDKSGNLYGTASTGGAVYSYGTAFKLSHTGSGWTFQTLYNFGLGGHSDGAFPASGITFGANGALYGATFGGGTSCNCGTVFNLLPPPTPMTSLFSPWEEIVLHRYNGGSDGAYPEYGSLIFDHAGNLYGTTFGGYGSGSDGTVYELTPSHGSWNQTIVYAFRGGSDGANPFSGVIFDASGNLYGTTYEGGNGYGTVFELSPSGSGWSENTLHTFQGDSDGAGPAASLTLDKSGNLYGTTCSGGSDGGGTVFELAPSGSGWIHMVLYNFSAHSCPEGSLTLDAGGNLYGTTVEGGAYQHGSVFKLTNSNGTWTYSSLHDFTGGSDGAYLYGSWVTLDANGKVYGTTAGGGTGSACAGGCGVVFEITP